MKLILILGLLAALTGASLREAGMLQREPENEELLLEILPEEEAQAELYLLTETGREAVTMEEYLTHVLLAEMPPSFPPEALKAQAIAARTFAERTAAGDKHEGNTVCSRSQCCQAYLSDSQLQETYGEELPRWREKVAAAVRDTEGLVMTYGGELIEAVYYSCSGGKTEDAVAVWGSEIPYLRSVESPGEEDAPVYRQELRFPTGKVERLLREARPKLELPVLPQDWFGEAAYTEGGGVDHMQIGSETFGGTELRGLLGLPSTGFSVTVEGNEAVFSCRGYGHRVGMSQYGAKAMARSGKTCEEILEWYYPGAEVTRLDR